MANVYIIVQETEWADMVEVFDSLPTIKDITVGWELTSEEYVQLIETGLVHNDCTSLSFHTSKVTKL